MAREGLVHEAMGPRALLLDVESTRGTRWALVEGFVPRDAWLTGLSALWLEGLCDAPDRLDIAGPRGRHPSPEDETSPQLVMHSGASSMLSTTGREPRVSTAARACLDALAHSPAIAALPAVASALRAGAVSPLELADELTLINPHTHGYCRLASLVEALTAN